MPSGMVTLLFSDIEGSTLLLDRLGPAYAEALGAQRRILRGAWGSHQGTELGTEGDSFFVVFQSATDAVSAAVQAQRELADYSWPERELVRVRMGIHTGTPMAYDGGYVGMDVHRGARIAGVAHGGQVLVSAATAEFLGRGLADGVSLRDLGLHELKDLPELERLYQVNAEGLSIEFPPLRSLGAVSRLPAPGSPLIGREAELARLANLLASGTTRLVTLTGVGGSGKTRLALELARASVDDFPDGVHFVALAEARTAEQMWDAIAQAVGAQPGAAPVLARLRTLRALLVLDNLEQLSGAHGVVAEVLRAARRVTLVATSRTPLHISMEHEFPVSPLGIPSGDGLDVARASPSVQLFLQQGRCVRPEFELTAGNVADVVAVCRGLDGLPLAIEIAAARLKILSPHALLARLDRRLDLPATVHDVPDRQRTLRSTIAWSYDLLSAELKTTFSRLAVFAGGADLAAISSVLTEEEAPVPVDPLGLITSLLDASLVVITDDADAEPRIWLLENVRAFALDQLAASGELDRVRARHAHHYLKVVQSLERLLHGTRSWEAYDRLGAEHDNLRAALRWALESEEPVVDVGDRSTLAMRLCSRLGPFWDWTANYVEARHWFQAAIAQAENTTSPELARCLTGLAVILSRLGEHRHSWEVALAAVRMLRYHFDTGESLAAALRILAMTAALTGHTESALQLYEQALDALRGTAETPLHYLVLGDRAIVQIDLDPRQALTLLDEAIALARSCDDVDALTIYRGNRAGALRLTGRVHEAKQEMIEIMPTLLQTSHPRDLANAAEEYASILAQLGDHQPAVRLLGAADAQRARTAYARDPGQDGDLLSAFKGGRAAMSQEQWHRAYQRGRQTRLETLLRTHVEDHL